jgi:magnesium chelatase family protein
MVAKVNTVAFLGINIIEIEVQVHIGQGIPGINIVGLPDKAVGESKERVRAAFQSAGLSLPQRKVIINLAPADIHKEGSHYDLAIALGLLVELNILSQEEVGRYIIVGELSLDGTLNAISGALPAAIGANAREKGLVCPKSNGSEALWSGNKNILAAANLLEIVNHFKGEQVLSPPEMLISNDNVHYPDLKDVKGQRFAKRALEIAAAGGHNMLMIGPPGSGKSMLAKRLPGILPKLTSDEMLEISIIASIAGQLLQKNILRIRPFRDPHCSSSMPAMVGGGKNAKPGEVTLAHLGVLFLDELPEYNRNALEALRQPIESGSISIARVNSHITYPAKFQLIAAMNPCKCGYLGDATNACSKAPKCGEEYQSRISGPLLDRFDICVDVPPINTSDLHDNDEEESSEKVAQRVAAARDIQLDRYKGTGIKINAHIDGELLNKTVILNPECKNLLQQAMEKFSISMRGYNRIIKVARTIADLYGIPDIERTHIAEALNYRMTKLRV